MEEKNKENITITEKEKPNFNLASALYYVTFVTSTLIFVFVIFHLIFYEEYEFMLKFLPDTEISNVLASVMLTITLMFLIAINIYYKKNRLVLAITNILGASVFVQVINVLFKDNYNDYGILIESKWFLVRKVFSLEEKKQFLSDLRDSFDQNYAKNYFVNNSILDQIDLNAIKNKIDLKELVDQMVFAQHQKILSETYTIAQMLNDFMGLIGRHPYITLIFISCLGLGAYAGFVKGIGAIIAGLQAQQQLTQAVSDMATEIQVLHNMLALVRQQQHVDRDLIARLIVQVNELVTAAT